MIEYKSSPPPPCNMSRWAVISYLSLITILWQPVTYNTHGSKSNHRSYLLVFVIICCLTIFVDLNNDRCCGCYCGWRALLWLLLWLWLLLLMLLMMMSIEWLIGYIDYYHQQQQHHHHHHHHKNRDDYYGYCYVATVLFPRNISRKVVFYLMMDCM